MPPSIAHSLAAPEASNWGRAIAGAPLLDGLLVALLVLALRVPAQSVSVIADWDESAFILMAREIVQGHLPYLSFWDLKPVGAGVLLAGPLAAFGLTVEVARAVGTACVLATCWLLYGIAAGFGLGRAPALLAAVFYAAFSTRLQGAATITEILLAPFTAAGVLVMLAALRRPTPRGQLLAVAAAGLLFGLAVWVKYVPALPATLVGGGVLALLLARPEGRLGRSLGQGVAFGAALLLPTLLTALVYWRAGALDEFLYANFGFAGRYVAVVEWHRVLRDMGETAAELWPLALCAATVLLPAGRRVLLAPGRWPLTLVAVLWLLGEAAAASLPMQFWPHYFLMPLPPLCLLAALGISAHLPVFAAPGRTARVAVLAGLFVVLVPIMRHAVETARAVGRADVPRRIAAMAQDVMRPGDIIWVVDYESIIYLLAGAPLPTRFAFPDHLIGPTGNVTPVDPYAEIGRILDQRPALLVLADRRSQGFQPSGDPRIKPLIEATLARDYGPAIDLKTADGMAHVFIRRDRLAARAGD